MFKNPRHVAEDFLRRKLDERKALDAYRQLRLPVSAIDFCSNDYLGITRKGLIEAYLREQQHASLPSGSTGSRLLTGNYKLIEETEQELAQFHEAACALLFNSGYDANTGLLSCVPQRGDTILYDYLIHASLRDGIRLSFAQGISFAHNDMDELEKKMRTAGGTIFVVTESVFSMDGDLAPLGRMADLCTRYDAHLMVDEAHATGVIGVQGEGLVQQLQLQQACFARIHTFGKACGAHGAIVLGSESLRNYLINFSRPFMYTTALPPASVAAIRASYHIFPGLDAARRHLQQLITQFQTASLAYKKLVSQTPVQGVVVPGNAQVKHVAAQLQQKGFDVRPILYPTVPKGQERLRIVLHAFNTEEEVRELLKELSCLEP